MERIRKHETAKRDEKLDGQVGGDERALRPASGRDPVYDEFVSKA
jgi:hypothetical protein